MTRLTQEQIDALPGLLAEATPGLWKFDGETEVCIDDADVYAWICNVNFDGTTEKQAVADARLIAQAPALAAHIVTTEAGLAALREENTRLREALTPSGETKAAYVGEFSFTIWDEDEEGTEWSRQQQVPWNTIKKIMVAISARAALSPPAPEVTE